MKVLILAMTLLTLSISATALAAEQKTRTTSKVKVDKSEKTMNIESGSSKDEEIIESTATLTDKHSMKAHVICKSKDGHEYKQGETGYDACIQKVKADKHTKSEPAAAVEVKLEK